MFNLDQSIAEWRRQMLAAGIKTPVPLAELESHLRAGVEHWMRSGLSAREAFDAAVQQIGQASALKTEFAKVGEVMSARQRKINWMVCAVAAFLYGALGVAFLFRGPLAFRERMLIAGACVSIAVMLCSWRFSCRFLPALPGKRMRTAIAFLSIVLSGFCSAMLLRSTPGTFTTFLSGANVPMPFIVAVLWALLPGAAALSLSFGLEEAAYRKLVTHDL